MTEINYHPTPRSGCLESHVSLSMDDRLYIIPDSYVIKRIAILAKFEFPLILRHEFTLLCSKALQVEMDFHSFHSLN